MIRLVPDNAMEKIALTPWREVLNMAGIRNTEVVLFHGYEDEPTLQLESK